MRSHWTGQHGPPVRPQAQSGHTAPCTSRIGDDDGGQTGGGEQVIDVCTSNPCQHGGVCVPSADGNYYQCQCKSDFSGHDCETLYGGAFS